MNLNQIVKTALSSEGNRILGVGLLVASLGIGGTIGATASFRYVELDYISQNYGKGFAVYEAENADFDSKRDEALQDTLKEKPLDMVLDVPLVYLSAKGFDLGDKLYVKLNEKSL